MLMEKTTRRLRKAKVTIGLDLGDKRHRFCVLDSRGEVLKKSLLFNECNELAKLAGTYPGALGGHGGRNSFAVDQPIS